MAGAGDANTQRVRPSDARAYLGQGMEYLHGAQVSFDAGNYKAAAGNAVIAGISGADAIAALRLRAVWKGVHDQAAQYLERAGSEGRQAARHLRRLLPLKTRSQYDPTPVTVAQAQSAVMAAERLLVIATGVVAPTQGKQ